MGVGDVGRWGDHDVVGLYNTDGPSDAGEAAVLAAVTPWAAGAVLDLGVGGGRTTGLLALRARRYVGIEPSEGMLAMARRRHPGVDLRAGDARALWPRFGGAYDLVVFSFNGLDALDHDDRVTALEEIRRVVADDGRVVVSSLNRDGVSFDETPFTFRDRSLTGLGLGVARMVLHAPRTVKSARNHRRTRLAADEGATWSMRPLRAHEFRFVVHFASVGDTVRLLRAVGFEVDRAWSETGEELDLARDHHGADWVHYLCTPSSPAAAASPGDA